MTAVATGFFRPSVQPPDGGLFFSGALTACRNSLHAVSIFWPFPY